MVNYVYHTEKGGNKYYIEEKPTGTIVKSGLSLEKAKKMKRFLNFGGGFNGFTPNFLMERINVK